MSGNQTCIGIWALLATALIHNPRQIPEIAPHVPASTGIDVALAATSLKSSVPNVK